MMTLFQMPYFYLLEFVHFKKKYFPHKLNVFSKGGKFWQSKEILVVLLRARWALGVDDRNKSSN